MSTEIRICRSCAKSYREADVSDDDAEGDEDHGHYGTGQCLECFEEKRP
jgi:hypothetical protein